MSRLLAFQPRVYTAPSGGTPSRVSFSSAEGSGGGNLTLPLPSGIASGDYMILYLCHRGDTTNALTGGPTFTLAATLPGFSSNRAELLVYQRLCDGSESSSITIGKNFKDISAVCVLNRNVSGHRASAKLTGGFNTTSTCPDLTAVTNDLIYRVWADNAGSATPPSGTVVANMTGTSSRLLVMEFGPVSAGSVGTLAATMSASDFHTGATVAIGA